VIKVVSPNPRKPRSRIFLKIYGIALLGIGAAFIAVFYIFFAANNGMYFVWPYNYPQIGPTPVQAVFPVAVGIAMFAALLFGYVAVSNFKRPRANKPANITAAVFAILAIGAGSVMGYFASSNVPSWYYDAGPYLTWSNGQDTATSITVSWHSAISTGASVRFGTSPGNLNSVASEYELTQFHHVELTGLQPNTTYYYQVDASPFAIKQFTTAPRGNAFFSFVVWSDPRENDPYSTAITRPNLPGIMHEQLLTAGKEIAFSMCTGDTTARGVDYQTWKLFLDDICTGDFASNASNVVAVGNHERHDETAGINLHEFYPYDSTTYSFTWGQLHCVIIDPWNASLPGWDTLSNATYVWLQQDLADHADSTFKIIGIHPPPVSSGGSIADDLGLQVARLSDDYNVTAVFSGHIHAYWRASFNGTTYITNGLGGNANNGELDNIRYCRVDVNSTNLIISTIHAGTNTVVDSINIPA
jgi:hypothetical protein